VSAPTPAGKPCWRTLFLALASGPFIRRPVTWDPETGEFGCVEGPKGFETWQEAR